MVNLLRELGEYPNREGLRETPRRYLKALQEMTSGYRQDPVEILETTFPNEEFQGPVILRNVRFTSLCEHHLLPFLGTACVGYVPGERLVGLSKLARLVECFTRRLQIQERLTAQIAQAIQVNLAPIGVGVVIRAKHTCLCGRGANQTEAEMVTSQFLGESAELREVLLHGS